ncbi:DUF600 domain-containing protein [Pontibacillus marinus]|nr:DUF600 domain-containing protein [Pontibacillus marinus]
MFIYCSFEEGAISNDFFYCINGRVVMNHKLNEVLEANNNDLQYDTSVDRQRVVLRIINDNIKKINDLCNEHRRDMPTEIKLVYNVENNSLEADYKYENVYSNNPLKTAVDVAEEWFEEIKNG